MTTLVLLLIAVSATAADPSPAPEPPPLRWDALQPGLPPREDLFTGEYAAGMLQRPAGLTLDTWFHDGWMRVYALLQLDRVVPCAEIGRGSGPVWMFGGARQPDLLERTQVTIPDETFPHRDVPLPARRVFDLGNGQGILVVRHGKIVFEDYPGMDPAQRHHWMSISKSAVNMLMGRLVMEGKLDLTRKVEDYLPELKGKGYGGFTVQEVADMDVVQRDVLLAAIVPDPARGLRCQPQQRLDRGAGLGSGAELQQLAEQGERDDHRGGLEIDPDPAVVAE